VQAVMAASGDDQSGDHDDGGAFELAIGQGTGGDTVDLLHVVPRPDFGAQEAQAHLDEGMVEMHQNDVIAPLRHVMVERDGADLFRIGMLQSFQASRP
jgi:hypothetical protein